LSNKLPELEERRVPSLRH